MTAITCEHLTRKERLHIWMISNRLTCGLIADAIGEKENTVAKWLRSDTIPVQRRRRLEIYGIPPDLLPPGLNRPRGANKRRPVQVLALPPAAADAELGSITMAN